MDDPLHPSTEPSDHSERAGGLRSGRRAFLWGSAGAVVVGAGAWAWLRAQGYVEDPPPTPLDRHPGPEVTALGGPAFDPRAEATLIALYGWLLPGHAELGLPSAEQASVFGYVRAAALLPGLRPLRNDILKLARFLDREAQSRLGGPPPGPGFSALDEASATQVLLAAQEDEQRRGRFVPARALEAALRLGLEGYLGHPEHGGNRDFVSWDALGIAMPRRREAHGSHL